MKNPRITLWAVALACLACLPAAAQQRTSNHGNTWVIADFNGDNKLDIVSLNGLSDAEPRIQFGSIDSGARLTGHAFPMQRLRARDLDGDADQDLVLETMSSVAIAVWINDGSGHFERANLEDFGFQLSHQSSRGISSVARSYPSELTDEIPRGSEISSLSSIGLPPACVGIASVVVDYRRTRFRTGIGSRGPPLYS